MKYVQLRDAKARLSEIIDDAMDGEFTMITRHGSPVAALISVAAADTLPEGKRLRLVDHLVKFPGPVDLDKDRRPPREFDL
jgi:prevent-host-death family protein